MNIYPRINTFGIYQALKCDTNEVMNSLWLYCGCVSPGCWDLLGGLVWSGLVWSGPHGEHMDPQSSLKPFHKSIYHTQLSSWKIWILSNPSGLVIYNLCNLISLNGRLWVWFFFLLIFGIPPWCQYSCHVDAKSNSESKNHFYEVCQ